MKKFLIAAFIIFCFSNVYGDYSGFTPAQSGGSGADANGYYLVSRSTNAPTHAINFGAGSTGIIYCTVSGGVCTFSVKSIGTDVQAYYATLDTWGAHAAVNNGILGFDGSGNADVLTTLSVAAIDVTTGTLNIPNGTTALNTGAGRFYFNTTSKAASIADGSVSYYMPTSLAPLLFTTGATTARTITFPDAAITVARIDAAQTFTGVQNFASSPTGVVEKISATFDWRSAAIPIPVNSIAYVSMPYAVSSINTWQVVCSSSDATGIIFDVQGVTHTLDTLPTATYCGTGTSPRVANGHSTSATTPAAWDCATTSFVANTDLAFKVTTAPTTSQFCTVTLKVTR